MADGREQQPARFSAFISYSRSDVAAARRIHRRLETYRLPRRLHPENQAWNEATRRLKPVFRDHDELTAAPDLGEALQQALAQSEFLIVLCSPASAQSEWVGREIAMFRSLHGDANILAALIEGSPKTAFHPELSHGSGSHGQLRPLAADFRRDGDGARLALLKLVAVMAGVGLGDLVQRDAQRRMRTLALVFATVVAVLAIVAGLIFLTMNARLVAERERARGSALSGYMLEDLRKELKSAGRLDLLQALNKGVNNYYAGQDLSQLSDTELELRAKLLLAMGEDDEQRGDLAKARGNIEEARRTTAKLLAAAPNDASRIFAHAQSEYYVGMINWQTGNREGAAAGFRGYQRLAEQLLAKDSNNPDWQMEVGYARSNLGMFVLRTDLDTAGATRHFGAALAAFEAAARLRPGDGAITSAIADAHAWLADTRRVSGDYAGARQNRDTQRRLLESLAKADPLDKVVQRDLISNTLAQGRILAAEGRHRDAIALFESGGAAARQLAAEDSDNKPNARQVRIFDLFKLRSWLALPAGERPAATVLAGANGDCAADVTLLKSQELARFCQILEARRTGQAVVLSQKLSAINYLSDTWGINFAEEQGR